jgi:hypothetical protein
VYGGPAFSFIIYLSFPYRSRALGRKCFLAVNILMIQTGETLAAGHLPACVNLSALATNIFGHQ